MSGAANAFARPAGVVLAALMLAALVGGCGDDEKDTYHGLTSLPLESDPKGEPIEVRYDVPAGTVRTARIRIDMRVWERRRRGPRPGQKSAEGSAVLSLRQTFEAVGSDGTRRSKVELRYVEAEGTNAEAYRARAPITGTLEHDSDGRPRPRSLRVKGGTRAEQIEALDLIGALLFAGLGGSPPWLPARPVRVGEAWRLEDFMRPRALDSVIQEAARRGVTGPTPTFSGTARLAAVDSSGEKLDIVIDALIEVDGPFHKDGRAGTMSIGNRFRGRAQIDARTGLPLSFQVTHTGSKDIRSGPEHIRQEFTSEVQGTVTEGGRPGAGG